MLQEKHQPKPTRRDRLKDLVILAVNTGASVELDCGDSYNTINVNKLLTEERRRHGNNGISESENDDFDLKKVVFDFTSSSLEIPNSFARCVVHVIRCIFCHVHVKKGDVELVIYGSPDEQTRQFIADIIKDGKNEKTLRTEPKNLMRVIKNTLH